MKTHKTVKFAGTALCEAFAAFTVVFLLVQKQYDRLPLALGTLLLVLLPAVMERLFRCRLCLPLYIFALLYGIGPMLGQCWNFYYTVSWWDKLLHICGGVMFAIVGAYFFTLLTKRKDQHWAGAVFALCFSIAVAAVWEFVEFGADCFLGADMQDDTVINRMTSYLLGDGLGVTGRLENIHTVTVNGALLPVNGYIDIGLIDSMLDMLLESLGALVTCLLLLADRGRHPLVLDRRKQKEKRDIYGQRICDL